MFFKGVKWGRLLLLFAMLSCNALFAQQVFNANYGNVDFLAASKVHKVGTNGQTVGNVTLYTNVINIGGQAIDCIIRTVSLTNGTFTLPGGAPGGTIAFDYSSATGTGMSSNQDRFFSPTFNFNTGGGSCAFNLQFILGGSYNNTTNTGTPVILQNVQINTYDIDGNGGANTNQFNEFGEFNAYILGAGSRISLTYNTSNKLTRFRSNISTNVVDVVSDSQRVSVQFPAISDFDIAVGASGSGAAFFFLDFGPGVTWRNTPVATFSPRLDLNTAEQGDNNALITCNGPASLSSGTQNITNSTNSVSEMTVTYDRTSITSGNNEQIIVRGTSPLRVIPLGFTATDSSVFSFASVNVKLKRTVSDNINTLAFSNNSGASLTTAVAEALFDSLAYANSDSLSGERVFELSLRETSLTSPPATSTVALDCTLLPVTLLYVTAERQEADVLLRWATAAETGSQHYSIERSADAIDWVEIDRIAAAGESNQLLEYSHIDRSAPPSSCYYRIRQVDLDGAYEYFPILFVEGMAMSNNMFRLYPNPAADYIFLEGKVDDILSVELFDAMGRRYLPVLERLSDTKVLLDFEQISRQTYYLQVVDITGAQSYRIIAGN